MDFEEEQLGEGEAELIASKKISRREDPGDGEGILTVDVYQTDDEIVIKSTVAGAGKDEIDIAVTNDMVTIKGSRRSEEKVRQSNYFYQELYWGSFSRSIILPEEIDPDKAKASIQNGILTLRLPKMSKSRTRKINITS